MKLTALEIKGFKSFADKTVVHFNNNMTGIVGPNGCGKSNVVDAIRWVIGEQKARTLRSNKMEDLIFNGSKSRNASQLAEVGLTFENTKNQLGTEFSTIKISRMYFRNGESEYRINDVPCRLKDIHNLFLDTGVSSDSYAIIELKMIDEIINDKENSRRNLFEQAAGISKYKERKKETISKLDSTQVDLNRVEDLLFEIEGNLKTLEAQAKKAKKYYELKEEYKRDSIELSAYSLVNYKDQFDVISKQQEEESDKKLQIDTEINQLEAGLEKDKTTLIDKEKRLSNRQKEYNELVNSINLQEGDKKLGLEKIKFLVEKQANLELQISQSQTLLGSLENEVSNALENREQIINSLATAEQLLQEAKQQLDLIRSNFENKRKVLADEQQKKQLIDKQYFEVEKEVAVGDAQKNSLISEMNQSAIWVASTAEQKEAFVHQLANLTAEVDDLQAAFQAAEEQEEGLQATVRQTREELEKLRQDQAINNRQLDQKQNEYNLTKSMVDKLEGFPDSIKFLKQQSSFPKDTPLLSDIIVCKEEYKAAVENLLEPYLNYYVVPKLADAVQAIHLLSDAKKGKANFFVLEELAHFQQSNAVIINNAFSALSITEVDSKFQGLIHYLLGNVYFVEDMEQAPVAEHPNCTFITTNAQFIRTQFSLTGGHIGLFEGKRLGRLKNLEKLQADIEVLQTVVADQEEQIKSAQSKMVNLSQALQGFNLNGQRNRVNQKTNELIAVKTKLENVISQSKNNEDRQAILLERIGEIEEKQLVHQEKLDVLRTEREAFQTKVDELTIDYNEANTHLQSESEAFNQTNIQFIQQQNQLKSIDQEINFKQNQILSIQTQYEQNQQHLSAAAIEYSQLHGQVDVLQIQLSAIYGQKQEQEKELQGVEEEYFKSRTEIEEREAKLKGLHKSKEMIDQIINQIKDKNNDLRLQLSSLKERLSIEFQVSIDDIIEKGPNPDLDYDKIQAEVTRTKERIDKFGEINPMAVEAFEEMNARYTFIQTQKGDLVTAKTSLEETMKEIEATASEKFLDAFTQIKANFINVFQKLFNEGDQCDLFLENPDDVLESKIEVVAKPKGKRPSTINQLSGGEKALTAIALLFSLYLLKPAPFCILDEVDAPLDDNNVGKFNSMIKEFSANSQFIIVTHNKSTMASVDVIYGVTMSEPGVSRLVPVDFRSLN